MAFICWDNHNLNLFSRESLFLLTYLLFLINTVVGLVVAIWRMVITALYNIIHLGRIDISLLHRTSESYDPGITWWLLLCFFSWGHDAVLWQIHLSYQALAARWYFPILWSLTFDPIQPTDTIPTSWRWRSASHTQWWKLSVGCCWTWWLSAAELGRKYKTQRKVETPHMDWPQCPHSAEMSSQSGFKKTYAFLHLQPLSLVSHSALTACSSFMLSGIQENRPNKATSRRMIRARWQLLYTLVNNPSLLGSRKHFQTLHTSESVLNGTPNRSSKKGSKKEAAKPAAEPDQSTETPTNQDKTDWDS